MPTLQNSTTKQTQVIQLDCLALAAPLVSTWHLVMAFDPTDIEPGTGVLREGCECGSPAAAGRLTPHRSSNACNLPHTLAVAEAAEPSLGYRVIS